MSNPNHDDKTEISPDKALYEAFSRAANSIIALHRQGADAALNGYNEGYAAFLIQFLAYIRGMDRRMIRTPHSSLPTPYINGDQILRELYGVCNPNWTHPKNIRHSVGSSPLSQLHSSSAADITNKELKRRLRLLKCDEEDNPFERELFKKFRRQRREPDSEAEDDML
ncbi:hypothetical protein DSO57_1025383 [Entomophthora muscae]|uniref:Uncharacterized protein n=1 Tax=Entomophthora muscae TaxID=34485 RepID=A0ACC2RH76_9FUNG|nr:hypothetical protein DSO57_1025383 [Entomophthora muscae]